MLIDADSISNLRCMAIYRCLELLVAVKGETYRAAVAVHCRDQSVERNREVILRTVANRGDRMHEQVLHREPAFRRHAGSALRDFMRPLRWHDHVERLRRRVVPAVRIIRFERGGFDGLRRVVALHHKPVRRRMIEFVAHVFRMEHALLVELAALPARCPRRFVLAYRAWEQHCVLQARERVLVVRRRTTDAHKAERTPRIAFERPGLLAIADDFIVELELVFRKPEAREIVVDQHGYGLSEIRRRLARRKQHVVAIEGGECQTVAYEIRGRDDPVGL